MMYFSFNRVKITERIFRILAFITVVLYVSGCNPSTDKDKILNVHDKIHVGVYNGDGASPICILETLEALKIDSAITEREVSPVDIQSGVLDNLDVLIFPGGSGSKQFNSLGQSSKEIVQEFAKKPGKGLVGICAGGYLFATTDGYPNLEIIPADNIRDNYDRGRGLIAFRVNDEGAKIFPELKGIDSVYIQYYDGPIFNKPDSSSVVVQAEILSDIATHTGYPHEVTPGKPAFLTSFYGEGKVFMSTGHPESTPGMRWMVPRMVRWTIDKPLISYDSYIVRPQIYDHEILYYPDALKKENVSFWKLFAADDKEIITALNNLDSIKSRPSIRWSIGLLRHQSPTIRLAAAKYLLETEYTYSIPDLECAVKLEKDSTTKIELEQLLTKLKEIIKN